MNASIETDLAGLYRRFLKLHPIQRNPQGWAWVESRAGAEAILLLPGFMGKAETSFLYLLALEADFRVVSLSYPPSVGRMADLCDGLVALMNDLGIQQAAVLGGSSSGFVAQAFVRRHPRRVSRLILTHTGLPSPQRVRTAQFYLNLLRFMPFGLLHWLMQVSIYAYFPRRTPAQNFWRSHFHEIICRQNRESLWNRFALMNDFHRHYRFQPADLAGWPGKILIMEMPRDHLTTPAEQAAMRELYPQASVHVFSETKHYDAVEQPEEQIRVIREFLLKVR